MHRHDAPPPMPSLMSSIVPGGELQVAVSRGGGRRLDRESIIDAAVTIAARREPDGLTSRVLGLELGVDRSAIWRHFENKDALLRAVGDRLLQMATQIVPRDLPPRARLHTLGRAVVAVFVAHPYVAKDLSVRTTAGPGEFAAIALMLTALSELGLKERDAALFQRTLSETVLAVAAASAGYSVLPEEVLRLEAAVWSRGSLAGGQADHPAIAGSIGALADVASDDVLECLLAVLLDGVEARAEQLSGRLGNSTT